MTKIKEEKEDCDAKELEDIFKESKEIDSWAIGDNLSEPQKKYIKSFISDKIQQAYERGKEEKVSSTYKSSKMYLMAFEDGKTQTRKEMLKNIGLLRQWLNEERITEPKKMVDNKDIEYWLKLNN